MPYIPLLYVLRTSGAEEHGERDHPDHSPSSLKSTP